jgi:hypothetical protein
MIIYSYLDQYKQISGFEPTEWFCYIPTPYPLTVDTAVKPFFSVIMTDSVGTTRIPNP